MNLPQRDIVVIGASSGGLEALLEIVPRLPKDLPASIFIVVHVPAQARSQLPQILSRAGPLPAVHLRDKDRIEPGRIYVAPPDFHLLVEDGYVRVLRGPQENNHRPAIDRLFRTAGAPTAPALPASSSRARSMTASPACSRSRAAAGSR